MKRMNFSIGWGALLIFAGLLFLAQTWDPTLAVWPWMWAGLFAVTGVTFLTYFWRVIEGWWAAIPGFTLLGLSALVTLSSLNWLQGAPLGTLFLGSIGLGFWAVYARRRDFWWAIIPGGALLSVAAVALFAESFPLLSGSVLFFGLAITFGLLMVLPIPEGPQRWALIPAGVLAAVGVLTLMNWPGVANVFWALALIGAGLYVVYRQWGGGEIARRH
jgi:hypothetical protein